MLELDLLVCERWDVPYVDRSVECEGVGFCLGFPSVGKSTLMTNLAGVYSEVASYEFTTLTTVPGVIRYKGAKIQV